MTGNDAITRTKFVVPRTRSDQIPRPRLRAVLARTGEAPITLVVAGAGYGKTSLVAGFAAELGDRAVWYGLKDRDADPGVFVRHLAAAVSQWLSVPDQAAAPAETSLTAAARLDGLSDQLHTQLQDDVWLILDDAHVLNREPAAVALLDQWLAILPGRLHMILVSRETPAVPSWPRHLLHGDAVVIDQTALAFDDEELSRLAASSLGHAEPGFEQQLRQQSAGWPIVAHLLCRHPIQGRAVSSDATTGDALIDYVVLEVLRHLSPSDLAWLERVSVLPEMQPSLCQALTGSTDSALRLKQLIRQGLPIRMTGDQRFELHPLVREALAKHMAAENRLAEVRQATATVLQQHGETDAALSLLLEDDPRAAANLLIAAAPHWLSTGRSHSILAASQRLTAAELGDDPRLSLYQAEAYRRTGHPEQALKRFAQAARAFGPGTDGHREALLGQAMVYLDTVQPQKAKPLLQQALATATEPAQIRQIEHLLAENALNTGDRPPVAGEEPPSAAHQARMLLRRGKLAEARRLLETALLDPEVADAGDGGHRRESLILAFVASLQGDAPTALHWARHGLERARACGSLSSEAVALARLGHALAIDGQATAARDAYRQSADMADALRIHRLAVESWFGEALLADCPEAAAEVLPLVQRAALVTADSGDTWLGCYVSLANAIVRRTGGDPDWRLDVTEAAAGFQGCDDAFGAGLSELWLRLTEGNGSVPDDWRWATEKASLFGPCGRLGLLEQPPAGTASFTDPQETVCLHVTALGPLVIRLNGEPVTDKAWSRRKAKALFAAFLTDRRRALAKSRLLDLLWPDLDGDRADGTFRVVLNALQQALPLPPVDGTTRRIIERDGSLYRVNRSADVRIDADDFENGLDMASTADPADDGAVAGYRKALSLYGGGLLSDMDDEVPGLAPERERLHRRFVTAGLRLASLLLTQGQADDAVHWAERILQEDGLVEEAYRLLIQAHAAAGDRARAVLAFERCEQVLADELGITPMPETLHLFERVTG